MTDETFLCVISTPNQLGPLQKIRLWHDSSGPSPNWFVSHVMVKELRSGQGWFFSAQCWLAVSLLDGRVQREFFCLHRGLGFWKVGPVRVTCDVPDWQALFGAFLCFSFQRRNLIVPKVR